MPDALRAGGDGPRARAAGSRPSAEYQTRDQPCFVGCFATYHWPWTSTKSDVLSGQLQVESEPFLTERRGRSSS